MDVDKRNGCLPYFTGGQTAVSYFHGAMKGWPFLFFHKNRIPSGSKELRRLLDGIFSIEFDAKNTVLGFPVVRDPDILDADAV